MQALLDPDDGDAAAQPDGPGRDLLDVEDGVDDAQVLAPAAREAGPRGGEDEHGNLDPEPAGHPALALEDGPQPADPDRRAGR